MPQSHFAWRSCLESAACWLSSPEPSGFFHWVPKLEFCMLVTNPLWLWCLGRWRRSWWKVESCCLIHDLERFFLIHWQSCLWVGYSAVSRVLELDSWLRQNYWKEWECCLESGLQKWPLVYFFLSAAFCLVWICLQIDCTYWCIKWVNFDLGLYLFAGTHLSACVCFFCPVQWPFLQI